jgi:hypothetical protein
MPHGVSIECFGSEESTIQARLDDPGFPAL